MLVLFAFVRASLAVGGQAWWVVRGHGRHASALARPKPPCANGGLSPRHGANRTARPDARTGAEHRVRPAGRWFEQRGHPGPPPGCAAGPRLAAALVQPPAPATGARKSAV